MDEDKLENWGLNGEIIDFHGWDMEDLVGKYNHKWRNAQPTTFDDTEGTWHTVVLVSIFSFVSIMFHL